MIIQLKYFSLKKIVRTFNHNYFSILYKIDTAPPIAPDDIQVIRISDTAINVSWTPLTYSEAQGVILYYELIYNAADSTTARTTVNASATASYIVISGLDPRSYYGVTVAAVTIVGVGAFSDVVFESGINVLVK